MVGTLTASVAAAVLFFCAYWMLYNCSVVGMLMTGRRRSERNRYHRRCRVFFQRADDFSGGFFSVPPYLAEEKTGRTVASTGMFLVRRQEYSVGPLPLFGVFFSAGFVRFVVGPGAIRSRFSPSAFVGVRCRLRSCRLLLSTAPTCSAPPDLPTQHNTTHADQQTVLTPSVWYWLFNHGVL